MNAMSELTPNPANSGAQMFKTVHVDMSTPANPGVAEMGVDAAGVRSVRYADQYIEIDPDMVSEHSLMGADGFVWLDTAGEYRYLPVAGKGGGGRLHRRVIRSGDRDE